MAAFLFVLFLFEALCVFSSGLSNHNSSSFCEQWFCCAVLLCKHAQEGTQEREALSQSLSIQAKQRECHDAGGPLQEHRAEVHEAKTRKYS